MSGIIWNIPVQQPFYYGVTQEGNKKYVGNDTSEADFNC